MKTISRIAYSNDKRNRTRSILIMMAICLTTMLLVIISTVGNGVIHLQKSQAASSYGSNYGLFITADGTQLKEVERRAEISDIGIMCTEQNKAVVIDKGNHHIGEFVKVRITGSTSATLFGEEVKEMIVFGLPYLKVCCSTATASCARCAPSRSPSLRISNISFAMWMEALR